MSQVQYLVFLRIFYQVPHCSVPRRLTPPQLNVFYYIFLGFAFLALLYGIIEPMCRKKQPQTLEEMMGRV